MHVEPNPYRRFGEYRESACDDWNAGYLPGERDEEDN